MKAKIYKILEERNVIDDHLLDIIGNEFKFDHQKGLAEWVKNSVAAYMREDVPDERQFIFLRFTDSNNGNAIIECVDFVGMTSEQIVTAFKRWGDPQAAMFGSRKRVPGGHGNGGKFYMRQMFKESYFITYKNKKLNIYGFSPSRKYGFASGARNVPMRDVDMSPDEVVSTADLNSLPVPKEIIEKILSGDRGFTVVRGVGPLGMVNKVQSYRICERLRNHPQVRKHLERVNVSVVHNGRVIFDRIVPDKLEPKPGFEEPFVFEIPEFLSYRESGQEHIVEMSNKRYPSGRLILKTSAEALERAGRFGELNRVDFIGELGVVASYLMYELGTTLYPQAVFTYGECECPILEDPNDDCVKNDRSKLIAENPKTKALLQWIGERVNEVAGKIMEQERQDQKELEKQFSTAYNELLNRWSVRFLNRIRAELLVGPGEGPGMGAGTGGESGGLGGTGRRRNNGEGGTGKGGKEGGGNTPKKHPRFPKVLLSGMDADPLDPEGKPLLLDPRHPIVYQRLQDVGEGIYWINTSSPLAKSVLDRFGERSQQWRSYLFQRYVDIFVKEEIRNLFSKDSERFNPDALDAEIFGRFMLRVHEAAAKDLAGFLLEERYDPQKENSEKI